MTVADALEARFGERLEVERSLDENPALARMAGRRSHRRFRPEPVSPAVLDAVLACALSAPSKSDLQQACIVRLDERGRRDALADLVPGMPWVREAPVALVVCGDNRRIRRICEMRGRPFANDHLDSFFNASVDAGIVLASLVHAAEAAGLGCCPVSVIRNRAREVRELLGLPAHVFPVAGLVIGHPAETVPLSPRLPLSVTVHRDRYDDTGLEAEIDGYDRRRSAAQPIAVAAQRHVDRYGTAERYGWSEDKARQVSVAERADFGAFVRGQGFRLD